MSIRMQPTALQPRWPLRQHHASDPIDGSNILDYVMCTDRPVRYEAITTNGTRSMQYGLHVGDIIYCDQRLCYVCHSPHQEERESYL
jgi:hypothetical protein